MATDLEAECAALRAVAESAADVVCVLSASGTLLRSFKSRNRLFGWEPGEVAGMSVLDLIHPDDHSAAHRALLSLSQSHDVEVRIELRVRSKAGEFIDVECLATNRLEDPAVRGVILHLHDIRERRALERRLHTAIRAEAVGRVAGAVAHDFNNLLSTVLLAAHAAELEQGESQNLTTIRHAAEQAGALTRRLLAFVKQKPIAPSAVDLNAVACEIEQALGQLLPPNITLVVDDADEPAWIDAEPALLEQLLVNLVLNARDAMPGGGNVRVAVRTSSRAPGPVAVLTITDDGTGMDEHTRAHAFEPFFTTRSDQGGTGLGLWSVAETVERFRGRVTLETALGRGTTFVLEFPLRTPPPPKPETASVAPQSAGSELVLLVDDRAALRQVLAVTLRAEGYRVLEAADGEEALSRVESSGVTPSVLVTDVLMPRLGGLDLSRRLRARYPELPVVFMSGFHDEAEPAGIGAPVAFLPKPFQAGALLETLRRLV